MVDHLPLGIAGEWMLLTQTHRWLAPEDRQLFAVFSSFDYFFISNEQQHYSSITALTYPIGRL